MGAARVCAMSANTLPALLDVPLRPLTPKQHRFVNEYLVDLNATAACRRAGFSAKTANVQAFQLMKVPAIAKAIQVEIEARSEASRISGEWVLANLKAVAERCLQAVAVFDREGTPTGEWGFDATNANRALELLGRHKGLFSDRIIHQGNGPATNAVQIIFSDDPAAHG
jgi:phage terminase small subunit